MVLIRSIGRNFTLELFLGERECLKTSPSSLAMSEGPAVTPPETIGRAWWQRCRCSNSAITLHRAAACCAVVENDQQIRAHTPPESCLSPRNGSISVFRSLTDAYFRKTRFKITYSSAGRSPPATRGLMGSLWAVPAGTSATEFPNLTITAHF